MEIQNVGTPSPSNLIDLAEIVDAEPHAMYYDYYYGTYYYYYDDYYYYYGGATTLTSVVVGAIVLSVATMVF